MLRFCLAVMYRAVQMHSRAGIGTHHGVVIGELVDGGDEVLGADRSDVWPSGHVVTHVLAPLLGRLQRAG